MSFFDSLKRIFGARPSAGAEEAGGTEHISCEEALQLVHDFIDGELTSVSHAEVEAHFEVCRRCYPHLRLERRFREAVRRACVREQAPPELRERVLQIVSGRAGDA